MTEKKIRSRGTHHIAFAEGKKTIWHFKSLSVNAVGADYLDSINDGVVRGINTNYATARSTATEQITSGYPYLHLGQTLLGGAYYVMRCFLRFDTSAIPDGETVTQVNLKMVCVADYSATNFSVQIVKQDWSAQDPITDANMEVVYDNCLAGIIDDNLWRNTLGMAINTQYASGNLNCAWVNKTGNTYYSLRSSRDYLNLAPAGDEYLYIASQEYTTEAYRPVLTVVTEVVINPDMWFTPIEQPYPYKIEVVNY